MRMVTAARYSSRIGMATLSLSAIVNPYHYRTSTAPRPAVTVSRGLSMHSASVAWPSASA